MTDTVIHEPWKSFLRELDSILEEETYLHCLGGFVVTQIYGFERKTLDIDAMSIIPRNSNLIDMAGKGSALHKRHGVYLDRVGVVTVPENYEDRLTEIYGGKFEKLRLLALDPYDIALAKIERNIGRDREDVLFLAKAVPFDLDILKNRYYEELRVYLGIPDREDLTLRLWIEMIEADRS
jgi:hypothetical protein